jgi:hypothetical protein
LASHYSFLFTAKHLAVITSFLFKSSISYYLDAFSAVFLFFAELVGNSQQPDDGSGRSGDRKVKKKENMRMLNGKKEIVS